MARTCALNRTSIDPVMLAALLIFVFISNLLYRAWRSRIHHSFYEFSGDAAKLVFKSDIGEFTFDQNTRCLEASYVDNRKVKLGFSDIRNIEIITEDNEAMLQEFFLEGFSVFIDTDPKYRDVVERYAIVVVTHDFKRYPLIAMTQYKVKDLWNVAVDLQLELLAILRMYVPIAMRAQDIYGKLKDILGDEFRFDKEL